MPLNKFLPGLITARPKLSIIAAAAIFCMVFISISLPDMATARIQNMLNSAGFEGASVTSISIRPSSIHASDIKLDPSGLDTIKNLTIDVNWFSFLINGKIKGLSIKEATISGTSDEAISTGRNLLQKSLTLPQARVNLSDIIIDTSTPFGDLRLRLNASIDNTKEQDTRNILAKLTADQYQLGFNSEWEGSISKDGILDITGNILDGRMNMGPLRISRFNGWFAADFTEKIFSAQGQLEAGSATFMNIPLQRISLVNEMSPAQTTLSLRAGVSGVPNVLFTADLMKNEKQESFSVILKGKNLGGFLTYIDKITQKNRNISSTLLNHREFELSGLYQPDRRFVGGPLPFSIMLDADDSEILEGNVLFYTETMEIRGSVETDAETATALQNYFKIPSANIKQNFIRLDGDANSFFKTQRAEAN